MEDLNDLRGRLDGVDRRLVETLRERLDTVAGIARIKAIPQEEVVEALSHNTHRLYGDLLSSGAETSAHDVENG